MMWKMIYYSNKYPEMNEFYIEGNDFIFVMFCNNPQDLKPSFEILKKSQDFSGQIAPLYELNAFVKKLGIDNLNRTCVREIMK